MAETTDTKESLARALKEQLAETSLERVTVSSLAQQVGITRQAFYYHFANVYELAAWLFQQEIADHIMAHATYAEWASGFEALLSYMRRHPTELAAVSASLSPGELERFFYSQFCAMMRAIVAELSEGQQVSERVRRSVVRHFAATVLGYLMRWLFTDMEEDPAHLVSELELLLRGQVRAALQTLSVRERETDFEGLRSG